MRKKTTIGAESESQSEMDQVEQLLQAAHDDVLLKLSLNSHLAAGGHSTASSLPLDPDLSLRFQALKSRAVAPKPSPPPSLPQIEDELKAVLGDDLSTRFAALRGTINPSPSSSSSPSVASSGLVLPRPSFAPDLPDRDRPNLDDDEEDEVEKLIHWAKDAARLDPSPPSDEEAEACDDEDTDSVNSSDDDDRDLYEKPKNRPRQRRNPKSDDQ